MASSQAMQLSSPAQETQPRSFAIWTSICVGYVTIVLWMDALADLQRQLPQGTFLKCCLSCRYANQCPTGSLPNELYCTKDASIRKKQDLFPYTQGVEASRRLHQYCSLCPDFQAQSSDFFTYNDYPYLLGVGWTK